VFSSDHALLTTYLHFFLDSHKAKRPFRDRNSGRVLSISCKRHIFSTYNYWFPYVLSSFKVNTDSS